MTSKAEEKTLKRRIFFLKKLLFAVRYPKEETVAIKYMTLLLPVRLLCVLLEIIQIIFFLNSRLVRHVINSLPAIASYI